jgi:hypothetical protein
LGEGKRGRGDEVRLYVNYYEIPFYKLVFVKCVDNYGQLIKEFTLIFKNKRKDVNKSGL